MATRRTPDQWPPIQIEYDSDLTPLRFLDVQSGVVFTAVEGEKGAAFVPDLVAATFADLLDRDAAYGAALNAIEAAHPELKGSVSRVEIDGVLELAANTADAAVLAKVEAVVSAVNAERAKPQEERTRLEDVAKEAARQTVRG